MKKIIMTILAMVCIFSVCSCKNDVPIETQYEVCAYIKEVKDNKIILDFAEYIESDDKEQIKELGLKDTDMPNGYYINNEEITLEEYTLTETTTFSFIDWNNIFVAEGEDREFYTTKREDFIKYLNTYENSEPKMPFFIGISGNKVISVTEKPMM